jgi:hypothetical protein
MKKNEVENIILDLDETLISAIPSCDFNNHHPRPKAKRFVFHDMEGYYMVFERPYLQEFLDFLFANYNVSVWTAASKDYAAFIVDKIILSKPDRKLDWVFFSYHCGLSKKIKHGSKNLAMLWDEFKLDGYTAENTVILDDYGEVRAIQPLNCIPAYPFDFFKRGSSDDQFLRKVQEALPSVRPKDYIPKIDKK